MIRWVRLNQYLLRAWFWILMAPITFIWLKDSILWIAMMSLYANIETAFGAHEARKGRDEAATDTLSPDVSPPEEPA